VIDAKIRVFQQYPSTPAVSSATSGRSLKIDQIELKQLFSANLYRSGRLDAPPFQPLLPGEIEWVKIRIDKAVTPCSL
jgi:hypothetical protein